MPSTLPAAEGEFESKASGRKMVPAGSVVLLFPGVWHRYRPIPNVGWDEYWVSFNGEYIERLIQQGFFSPEEPVLKTGLDDLILRGYLTLLDRLHAEPVGFEQLLAATVVEILAAALARRAVPERAAACTRWSAGRNGSWKPKASALPTIEKLAGSLGLSVARFHRVFKEHTGLSPYQYHSQLRLERAKQMLQGTTMTVKAISVALAFENPFHFSKVFKQKTGVSPSAWRKQGISPEGE